MAKFVRERRFKKNTALFRSNRAQPKRSGPFEKHYRINRIEGCCIDRLSRQRFSRLCIFTVVLKSPALVANLLCPRQEWHTLCELEVKIVNSG